ncbi:MAG: hypothetical protein ACLFP4_05030 [Spirochaetales bacterium]
MKVIELRDVHEKESLIHYRKVYSATASIESRPDVTEESRIEFVLEQGALGGYRISVKLLDQLNAPIVPAITAVKQHLKKLSDEGQLP